MRLLASALLIVLLLPRFDALFFGSDPEPEKPNDRLKKEKEQEKKDEEVFHEATDEAHDLPHMSPHIDDPLNVGGEGFDQKSILGSEEEAELFSEKSREEQEKGLRALIPKIDEDGNGTVSKPELVKWITHSLVTLKNEEAQKRFPDHDYDEDGKFTWKDHLYATYGFEPTEQQLKDGVPGIDKDEAEEYTHQLDLFRASDLDKNNELSWEEFKAFFRPEEYPHTQELEIKKVLIEHDTNKDGGLDLKEFLKAELHENDDAEWTKIETERFSKNWDLDKDGLLKGVEIRAWWMPNNEEVAKEEVEHLFGVADSNGDKQLSVDEMVTHLDTFVGSQATNYGEHLKDEL